MSGCSTNEGKRREIGCMFGDVPGLLSGIAKERAKEVVAMLMSERITNMVVECKRISPRLMWVKVKMGKEV